MERVLEVLRARVHSQGALERMAQEGLLPRARPDADLARTRAWLDAGAALGALEVG